MEDLGAVDYCLRDTCRSQSWVLGVQPLKQMDETPVLMNQCGNHNAEEYGEPGGCCWHATVLVPETSEERKIWSEAAELGMAESQASKKTHSLGHWRGSNLKALLPHSGASEPSILTEQGVGEHPWLLATHTHTHKSEDTCWSESLCHCWGEMMSDAW